MLEKPKLATNEAIGAQFGLDTGDKPTDELR